MQKQPFPLWIDTEHFAFGRYKHPTGGKMLVCMIYRAHKHGRKETYRSVLVDCRRGEYIEDQVRLRHWSADEGVQEHSDFPTAVAHVRRAVRSWTRSPKPKRGPGTCYSPGCRL